MREDLKKMFYEVTICKNASRIPEYYHKEFVLYSNGTKMGYEEFLHFHEIAFAAPNQYEIIYEEESFVEEIDKVACRLWITLTVPNKDPKIMEVILIATYKDGKIHRLWELVFPDWQDD